MEGQVRLVGRPASKVPEVRDIWFGIVLANSEIVILHSCEKYIYSLNNECSMDLASRNKV